jgi:ketosteroid isomerase-like protein
MLPSIMDSISPERVHAQVDKFWKILSGKSGEKLEHLYAPDAIVFTGRAKRAEPASLAAARRMRQVSGASSDLGVEVGQLEVQVVDSVAIASYTYRFHGVKESGDGGRLEKTTRYGRATQIFQLDDKGALQIVHEHLSAGEAPEIEKARR